MKNKKRIDKRKEDSESSSSSSSSEDDSKGSSSDSNTSPVRKKTKSSKGKHSKGGNSKTVSSSSDDEPKRSKAKATDSQDEKLKMDRKEIEHSRWDSPVERSDKKKKAERRESESREREHKKDKERDRNVDRDGRHDERHNDRPDSSRDRRNNDRPYNRRYEERGRHRDYRYERQEDRDKEKKGDRYHRGDDRRERKRSPANQRNNKRHRSRSASFDHAKAKWGREDQTQTDKKDGKANNVKEKEKPNFGLSGKLTEETNTYKGVVIKYSEPPEARKPRRRWRLYPFKGEKAMQTLYIHRESAYLIGRDRKVVDLPVDHPSCSKQHAALQYRLVPFKRDDGSEGKRVRPYLIDLDSANGTYINNKKIDPRKYVELLEKDVIKFGYSSREYVLLHENSKDEAMDDDVKLEEDEVKREPED